MQYKSEIKKLDRELFMLKISETFYRFFNKVKYETLSDKHHTG